MNLLPTLQQQADRLQTARASAIATGDWTRVWDLTDALDAVNDRIRSALQPAMQPAPLTMAEANQAA